jgi:Protein of unknown function (DUF2889)
MPSAPISHDPSKPRKILMRDPQQNVSGPAGPAPRRHANSVRRTSTIDMSWPDGLGTLMRLNGTARDALTIDPDEAPIVLATAAMSAGIGPNRDIVDITGTPARSELAGLIGVRGGGHLRSALDVVLPGERQQGAPLYLLLDDISGASLIGGFAWSRWSDQWTKQPGRDEVRPSMQGVCIGFSPGSSALNASAVPNFDHRVQPVVSLVHPDDPDGWHALAEQPEVSMRRARRIDVWRDGTSIIIDSAFQDSCSDPNYGRVAVHEYGLRATADASTGTLTSVDPDPRVLPYLECPSAIINAREMAGVKLADLRSEVLERLARTHGCTHLNDALRALAEVPVLLAHLHGN